MNEPDNDLDQSKSDQSKSQTALIEQLVKDEDVKKKIIDIDPITLVFIITLILLVPLLLTGFISH